MPSKYPNLGKEIIGIDLEVPLLDGSHCTYVNLDNAASTPAFRRVQEKVDQVMQVYSSVHRGSGFKSLLSTHLYDKARQVVARFTGADLNTDCVIFVKNTTEAINKLANRFPFKQGDMVLTTIMEHHSNDLPWREHAKVLHAEMSPDGSLNFDDLAQKLKRNAGRVKLVAVTGASNVTGYLPPIYDIAELAHQHGAMIMVDCAQLLPHRKIEVGVAGSLRHLDFIAFSGHKVYAPFGTGVLIGSREFFNMGKPDYVGGGTVEIVTLDEVEWTHAPERDEAGSPNVIGAVALACALEQLSEIGMQTIIEREKALTSYTLDRLNRITGLRIYGSSDPSRLEDRLSVIPFEVVGIPHAKLAAILSFEGGIGLRNGCFCAHPYVLRLLNVSHEEYLKHHERVMKGDRSHLPGFVRASLGCYNEQGDIDRLVEMLERVVKGDYRGEYISDTTSGSYYPSGFAMQSLDAYFSF